MTISSWLFFHSIVFALCTHPCIIFLVHARGLPSEDSVTSTLALSPPTVYVRYHTPLTVMQVMEVTGRSS